MSGAFQENIFKEVQREIGDSEVCSSNMKNLKYTEAVLMEILRLIPPVPVVGRSVGDDVVLSKLSYLTSLQKDKEDHTGFLLVFV